MVRGKALREFEESISAWSDVEDGIHLAFYEFQDLNAAHNLLSSDLMKEFIKEFDRHWAGKVKRTRDVFGVKQLITKQMKWSIITSCKVQSFQLQVL